MAINQGNGAQMTRTMPFAEGSCFGEGPRWRNDQFLFSDAHGRAVVEWSEVMKTMLSRCRSNCAVVAALASFMGGPVAVAQDYTVEVTPHLDGLDIKIEPVTNPGVLVVNLTNNTAQKVRCDLNFEADPQLPFQTFVFVEPGKMGSATLRATQQWFDVSVDVRCKADE